MRRALPLALALALLLLFPALFLHSPPLSPDPEVDAWSDTLRLHRDLRPPLRPSGAQRSGPHLAAALACLPAGPPLRLAWLLPLPHLFDLLGPGVPSALAELRLAAGAAEGVRWSDPELDHVLEDPSLRILPLLCLLQAERDLARGDEPLAVARALDGLQLLRDFLAAPDGELAASACAILCADVSPVARLPYAPLSTAARRTLRTGIAWLLDTWGDPLLPRAASAVRHARDVRTFYGDQSLWREPRATLLERVLPGLAVRRAIERAFEALDDPLAPAPREALEFLRAPDFGPRLRAAHEAFVVLAGVL